MRHFCLDANIFIQSWYDRYSIEISYFHNLWGGLITLNDKGIISIINPILSEIEPISLEDKRDMTVEQLREKYPLRKWMEDNRFRGMDINADDENKALLLEKQYQTEKSEKAISANDAKLVAYASSNKHVVVTYEARQPNYMGHQWHKKIPLVCKEQGVACVNFIEMLKEIEG